jgi:hypothetical protein
VTGDGIAVDAGESGGPAMADLRAAKQSEMDIVILANFRVLAVIR